MIPFDQTAAFPTDKLKVDAKVVQKSDQSRDQCDGASQITTPTRDRVIQGEKSSRCTALPRNDLRRNDLPRNDLPRNDLRRNDLRPNRNSLGRRSCFHRK